MDNLRMAFVEENANIRINEEERRVGEREQEIRYDQEQVQEERAQQREIDAVRDHVAEEMRDHVAAGEIRANPEQQVRALHNARGVRFLEAGHDVLEFDIAGSGYSEFPYRHVGLGGHGKPEARWWNKAFGWLPCVMSEQQFYERNAEGIRNFEERYGKNAQRGDLAGRKHIYFKKTQRENVRKLRVSMAGPLALGGASNSGEYSIENLRQYILQIARSYLRSMFRRHMENPADMHPVHIMIRGHSRGGVAAGEGAMMIKYWLHHHYPEFEDRVRFELIQYDPVPGFGSDSGANREINLSGNGNDENAMMPLGEDAETTVVYSLHTQHPFWFTPQSVKGARRIMLMLSTHDVGLNEIDNGHEHRRPFRDAFTGELYRSSGLNDLPEGVYIAEGENYFMQLTPRTVGDILDGVWDGKYFQKDRHNRILEVVKEWFREHPR